MTDYTYKITKLSTGYGKGKERKNLLQNMSGNLYRGMLTCLIGVNGVGKSTLMRTMAGLAPVAEGSVELLGRNIADYSKRDLAERVAVVLTDDVAEQNLTAFELVAMGRMPYTGYWGVLSENDKKRVDEVMSLVGMSDFRHRRLSSLSDGERRKLLIAKALAQDTDVILLDEPVAFLDFPSKVSVLRLLNEVAKTMNKSVLVSIHDLELALQTAGRLWVLSGNGFFEGEPRSLATEGRLDFLFDSRGVSFDRERLQYSLI